MMLLKYAWRNMWRNRRRTMITLAAVALNTAVLILFYALSIGMIEKTLRNVTGLVGGEAQAHARDYLEDQSLYKSLEKPEKIIAAANRIGVSAVPRTFGFGLAAKETKSAGAVFWGVRPEEERAFSWVNHLLKGTFLKEKPGKEVVLGKKLARQLRAEVGSEIIIVVQAADGSMGNEIYVVQGILKAIGASIDRGAVIMHEQDFRELFVLEDRIHEIAFHSKGRIDPEDLITELSSDLGQAEVKSWKELMPVLADMLRLSDILLLIFGGIFFVAAGLGVMNTMLMATYERMHEFGIQKAIGASPLRIVTDVLAEAFTLSAAGTALGALLGYGVSYYLQFHGIDLSRFSEDLTIAGIAFDPVWYTAIVPKVIVMPMLIMCWVCVLASLYPAMVAALVKPVEAIHHH
ncbi:MAG: ABC transporter permease [Planctomycetota bacterium]|nr:ABC transporter permease [Planctomycetota bacterium]